MTIIVHEPGGLLMSDSKRVFSGNSWDGYGGLSNKIVVAENNTFAYASCGPDYKPHKRGLLERAILGTLFSCWCMLKVAELDETNTDESRRRHNEIVRARNYWGTICPEYIDFPNEPLDVIVVSRDLSLTIEFKKGGDSATIVNITNEQRVMAGSQLAYNIYRRSGLSPLEAIQHFVNSSSLCAGPINTLHASTLNDLEFDLFIDFLNQEKDREGKANE